MRPVALAAIALGIAAGGLWLARRDTAGPSAPAASSGLASQRDGDSGGGEAATSGAGGPAAPDPLGGTGFDGGAAGDGARGTASARPRSLRGTRVDGGLAVDEAGRFVATRDARRLFDYFLAATGEEPDERIAERIRAEITSRLPPEAAREAIRLLDRYLAYRARARELAESGLGDADLETRLATLRALRRETLGPAAAEAFFADEEAVEEAAVASRRVARDPSLAADERAARLAAIEASLPPIEAQRRRESAVAIDLRRTEDDLRAAGASDAEVQAARESAVGAEAAARLAALDERRAEWQRRLDAYRAAAGAIAAEPGLDDAAKRAATEKLLHEGFSETERLRVPTLAPTPVPPAVAR